ncbi:MAG: S1 RNA-binding domain-containing protein [Turneriella sp.]|nr:S1 RNA-binding domain-containing protein [Leptospiraceae bacterium]MCX7631708.1 S1 RNA-binding domain-containing protein [Turneriella sp.]
MAVPKVLFEDSNISMEDIFKTEVAVADIRPGAVVTGKVVGVTNDYAIIDMGSKSEGRIALREFDSPPAEGDTVEALVRSFDAESGMVQLSKRELELRRGWEIVKEAFEKQVPVNAVVRRSMRNGYLVNVEGVFMFLPHQHVGLLGPRERSARKPNIVGETYLVKILELNERRKTGTVSRRAFQDEQNAALWKNLATRIKIGDIVSGTVSKHTKSGVFINVEGVEGFLHRSNITWERKADAAKEKLIPGDQIKVRVLEIDPENHRLSLGLKQLTEDPWNTVLTRFRVGDKVRGKVAFVARYGAFIELGDGLEGLLHINEMSWTRKIHHANEVVQVGQEIETKIIGINREDKRISLGLRQLYANPWDTIKAELRIGEVRRGTIRTINNNGFYVSLTDSIDGFVRREDVSWTDNAPDLKKLYKIGDEVDFKVIEINTEERKVYCSVRHTLPNPYKKLRDKYPRGSVIEGKVSSIADFGIFIRFDESFEGLAHISTIEKEQAANLKKHFKKGQEIKAVVKSIDPENRKISLSLKDVPYALEKLEMRQYLEKESNARTELASPFANLKTLVS